MHFPKPEASARDFCRLNLQNATERPQSWLYPLYLLSADYDCELTALLRLRTDLSRPLPRPTELGTFLSYDYRHSRSSVQQGSGGRSRLFSRCSWTPLRRCWPGMIVFALLPTECALHPIEDGSSRQLTHQGRQLPGAVLYLTCDDAICKFNC